MKKRRQHYVWRHYLEAWAPTGKLWCHRLGENVFSASTQNIAHERDFYRLREMSEFDLLVVRKLAIEPLGSDLRKIAEGWIPHFTLSFMLQRQYQDTGSPKLKAAFDGLYHRFGHREASSPGEGLAKTWGHTGL